MSLIKIIKGISKITFAGVFFYDYYLRRLLKNKPSTN